MRFITKAKTAFAATRNMSSKPNMSLDEMPTLMLAEFDAETRFQLRAERGVGKVELGSALLEKAAAP